MRARRDIGAAAVARAATSPASPYLFDEPADDVIPPGSEAMGGFTGAPVRTALRTNNILPNLTPTLVVAATRENRLVTFIAPLVQFRIAVGHSGVKITDLWLPPGLRFDVPLPGLQELYAVTDAPVVLPLRVEIAPLLLGDRERKVER